AATGRSRPAACRQDIIMYMAPLLERLRAHLDRARLFPAPGTAVLAVSGGPDSVALLDLMHSVAHERGLLLVVAHADHGIQMESGKVGRMVRGLAATYAVPFELGDLHLGPDATETAARRARAAVAPVQPSRARGVRRGARARVPRRSRQPRSPAPAFVAPRHAAAAAGYTTREQPARRRVAVGTGGRGRAARVGPCAGTRSGASASALRRGFRRCSRPPVPL